MATLKNKQKTLSLELEKDHNDLQLKTHFANQLWNQLDNQLENQLDNQLENQLRSQLYSKLKGRDTK